MGRASSNAIQAVQQLQELLNDNAQITIELPPQGLGGVLAPKPTKLIVTPTPPPKPGPADRPGGAIADLKGFNDLKPDPLTARTPMQFVELMKDYRIWAGEPSYRELVRRSGKAFGASSLCEALNSPRLPPEKLVRAFIWACSNSESDVQVWVTAWRQLRMRHKRAQGEPIASVAELHTPDQRRKTG
ncbi:hypothetical protein ACFFV7_35745 [Nonomuraea spiralis]|uniref:Uncharacterized protein n=1 Tax=Nonomuraea spiralis TaxID=46182 RepID=A0ABV5IPZ6_9ACTN|nr:hypothetical protein [Nonomuraea spiralis]GGT11150.1 hypothetical protein GCM10010176_064630 [Nonomuraea spiralis]